MQWTDFEKRILGDGALPRTLLPKPFPGSQAPVRVAWRIFYQRVDKPAPVLSKKVRGAMSIHAYIGKPNAYRAREALKVLSADHNRVHATEEYEFDASGLLLTYSLVDGLLVRPAYYAYHPYGHAHPPLSIFGRAIYLKRVGNFPTYSFTPKLTRMQIDGYYKWWEETMGLNLRTGERHEVAVVAREAKTRKKPLSFDDYMWVLTQEAALNMTLGNAPATGPVPAPGPPEDPYPWEDETGR